MLRLERPSWMHNHAIAVAFGIAIVVAATSGCRDIEVVTATYATLAEARQAGAIANGWMPQGLPEGAHDIREAHDLDTNRRWGLFSFSGADHDAMRALLTIEELPPGRLSCDVPGRIEWWPVLLRGTVDREAVRAAGLRAYRTRAGRLVFAVNWNQGRAYYWTEQ